MRSRQATRSSHCSSGKRARRSASNLRNQVGRPRIVLAALGSHALVGRPHPRGVHLDSAARVEIGRLEGPDHRPAPAEPFADDPVYVVDADDAVADEAVRLAQQRALEPVEDEPLELARERHDAHSSRLEDRGGAVDDVGARERRRNELDDRQQVRRVTGVCDQAAVAAGELCRDRGGRDRRRARGEDRVGRCEAVELREELLLQPEALGRALLHVRGARDGILYAGRRSDTGGNRRRRLAEQPESRELVEPGAQLLGRQLEPLRIGILERHGRAAAREDDRPCHADASRADDPDVERHRRSLTRCLRRPPWW